MISTRLLHCSRGGAGGRARLPPSCALSQNVPRTPALQSAKARLGDVCGGAQGLIRADHVQNGFSGLYGGLPVRVEDDGHLWIPQLELWRMDDIAHVYERLGTIINPETRMARCVAR